MKKLIVVAVCSVIITLIIVYVFNQRTVIKEQDTRIQELQDKVNITKEIRELEEEAQIVLIKNASKYSVKLDQLGFVKLSFFDGSLIEFRINYVTVLGNIVACDLDEGSESYCIGINGEVKKVAEVKRIGEIGTILHSYRLLMYRYKILIP